jgi:PIN domain nuclease of toxin-antitoxin system
VIAYLDTNAVVWLAQGDLRRFSKRATRLLEHGKLLISPIVLLELEYLFEVRRLRLPARDLQLKLEHEVGLTVCDQPFALVVSLAAGEKWTRDPFDRIVVAQAKSNGLAALISADEEIAAHYARTVW